MLSPDTILSQTRIPRQRSSRRSLPSFDLKGPPSHGCTGSLACVLIAKKNSFTVSLSTSSTSVFYEEESLVDLSSPESVFSDFESSNTDFSRATSSSSSPVLMKSCLSSVTSLSLILDLHPLQRSEKDEDEPKIAEDRPQRLDTELKKNPPSNIILNLSKSLKRFSFTPKFYSFMLSCEESRKSCEVSAIQLKTFNVRNTPLVESWDHDSYPVAPGGRSLRSSAIFLRLYAIGNVSQQKKLLPSLFRLEELSTEVSEPELEAIGEQARVKLFNHIKLAPRTDQPSENSLKHVKYVCVDKPVKNSLINNYDNVTFHGHTTAPWVLYDSVERLVNGSRRAVTLKTHGILKNSVQFTVKGYANPRWIEIPKSLD